MIDRNSRSSEHLDRRGTGFIEKGAIMRNDNIASLPGGHEVLLKPLDTRKVDKVGWLIEEEEVRS